MLSIFYNNNTERKRVVWKLNPNNDSPFPPREMEDDIGHANFKLLSLFADGKEFDYIINLIENIPHVKGAKSQFWRGELASFIFENLPER